MANACEIKNDDSLVNPVSSKDTAELQKSDSTKLDEANTNNENAQSTVSLGKIAGSMGGDMPLVQINGYTFSTRELVRLEIDQSDFYPTLNLTIKLETGIFLSRHFPKDGDLISVFIRSFTDVLKPIRNDYYLTKLTSSKSQDGEGNKMTLFIRGILNVPLLYAEQCMGIKQKSSFDSLVQIATDLKLGFASNETATDDIQNWLCPYITYKEFIDYVVKHSWKDDASFFWSYIDYYYNLNFLNMNKLFIVPDSAEAKEGVMRGTFLNDMYGTGNISNAKAQNILTNSQDMQTTNYYYDGLQMINKSGEINILNGYKRFVHFFEKSMESEYKKSVPEKHSKMYTDPMVTPGSAEKKVLLKGRPGEDIYKFQIKHKWQGIQYGLPDHNVHKYYKYAELHNFQNVQEMSKLNLRVILPNPNFNFFKGQRVPLTLVVAQDPERIKVAGNEADKARTTGATLDRFISGQYIILSTKLVYNQDSENVAMKKGKYSQELLLGRREWSMPDSIRTLDESDPEKWSSQKPL